MNTLLKKLILWNKPSIITGDFNLNLVKYMQNTGVNQFLEKMPFNRFIPQKTLPTRITEKIATLIDNILQTAINIFVIVYQVISLLTFLTTSLSF